MKPKNLLRIKVNEFNLIKVSLINGVDFNFSYPRTNLANQIVDSHFSLHTKDERLTFKTISIKKAGKELLPLVIEKAKNNQTLQNSIIPIGQIDLLKGKSFDFSNPKSLTDVGMGIALNLKNVKIENLFINKRSKSKDESFPFVKDISIPVGKDAFKLKCLIGKNFTGSIAKYTRDVNNYCVVQEKNNLNVEYTFLFLIKYEFPTVTTSKSAITV